MEQFNKALSFILGLIVVAVFIVVASGKFNFKGISFPTAKIATNITPTIVPNITPKPTSKPFFSFLSRPTAIPTPKPTVKPAIKPTPVPQAISSTSNIYSKGEVQQQNKQDQSYHPYTGSPAPTSIPNTGIPILLFPLFGTSLLTGIFMKKTGKRD